MKFKKYLKPSWLVSKIADRMLEKLFKKYARGNLIDIGCGVKPYAKILKPYIKKHIGVDHVGMIHSISKVDIFADAYNIPVENNEFDTILCTEVIEHLEEPSLCFKEMYRILKHGGYAIITCPFFWHLHEEPRDFYRYTKYGLKYLVKKNKFEVISIESRGGLVLSIFTELAYCINESTKSKILYPIKIIIVNILLVLASFLNKVDPTKNICPTGYVMVIKKGE